MKASLEKFCNDYKLHVNFKDNGEDREVVMPLVLSSPDIYTCYITKEALHDLVNLINRIGSQK